MAAQAITGDITKFAQSLLLRALEDCKSSDASVRLSAQRWLLDEDNYTLALILEAVTPDIHLDWIRQYVKECNDELAP